MNANVSTADIVSTYKAMVAAARRRCMSEHERANKAISEMFSRGVPENFRDELERWGRVRDSADHAYKCEISGAFDCIGRTVGYQNVPSEVRTTDTKFVAPWVRL